MLTKLEQNQIRKIPEDIFKHILEDALIPHCPTDMFLTSKPNANIINRTPYKIN